MTNPDPRATETEPEATGEEVGPAPSEDATEPTPTEAPPPQRSLTRRVLLATVAALLVLVLAELLARLAVGERLGAVRFAQAEQIARHMGWGRASRIFAPDPECFWRLKPGVMLPEDRSNLWWGVVSNRLGFRSGEFARRKPPGTVRVVCFGDSTTFGAGVAMPDAWPSLLELELNRRGDDVRYEVINAGVPGYSSYQGLKVMEREVAALSADIVLVTFGNNDAWPWDNRSDREHAEARHAGVILRHSRLAQLLAALLTGSPKLGAAWAERVIQNETDPDPAWTPRVSPAAYQQNLRAMAALCAAQKPPLILVVWPWRVEVDGGPSPRADYQYVARRVAAELQLPSVELLGTFQKPRNRTAGLYLDSIRVGESGHRLVAREVYRVVQKHFLRKR